MKIQCISCFNCFLSAVSYWTVIRSSKNNLTEMALCNMNRCVKTAFVYDILEFKLQISNVKTYLEKNPKRSGSIKWFVYTQRIVRVRCYITVFSVLKQGSEGVLTSGQLFCTVPKYECTFSPDPQLVCTHIALDSTMPLPRPCLLLRPCAHTSLVHYSQHTQQLTMRTVSTEFRTLYLKS